MNDKIFEAIDAMVKNEVKSKVKPKYKTYTSIVKKLNNLLIEYDIDFGGEEEECVEYYAVRLAEQFNCDVERDIWNGRYKFI